MITYVFHFGVGDAPPAGSTRFTLASDLAASVRAFDLLRSHPDRGWVLVTDNGEAVLKRVRVGEKQAVAWLRPRPAVAVRPSRSARAAPT